MVADLVMINLALLLAFSMRFFSDVFVHGNFLQAWQTLTAKLVEFGACFGLLSISMLVAFNATGLYSQARKLSAKAKLWRVFQAVTVTFVVFAAANYVFNLYDFFPRSLLAIGWGLAFAIIGFSRIWSALLRKMTISAINNDELDMCVDEKSVLVIGGAGYIGSALIPRMLESGYTVRLLDCLVYGDEAVKPYLSHPRLQLFKADFRQVDQVVKAVKGVGTVIHLGAIVGDPACSLDENFTIEVNLMATRMIAEVCKGFGVKRFIFASTCSVYGASDDVLDEGSKLNPVSLYAKSKIACEQALMKMADAQFSPVILRFSTIFGLSGRTRFDLVVNLLSAKAMFDKEITVIGGEQWRPFLHVDDAANSVFCVLQAPLEKVSCQVYNVGSDNMNYTIGQVGELIHKKVPDSKLLDLESDQDRRNYRVSFAKINGELGYQTRWSLEQGIDQVIKAIEEGRVLNYRDARFNNANFLKDSLFYTKQSAYYRVDLEELEVVG
jgi:nucleoside-diphosphate-sugar epimerase